MTGTTVGAVQAGSEILSHMHPLASTTVAGKSVIGCRQPSPQNSNPRHDPIYFKTIMSPIKKHTYRINDNKKCKKILLILVSSQKFCQNF